MGAVCLGGGRACRAGLCAQHVTQELLYLHAGYHGLQGKALGCGEQYP